MENRLDQTKKPKGRVISRGQNYLEVTLLLVLAFLVFIMITQFITRLEDRGIQLLLFFIFIIIPMLIISRYWIIIRIGGWWGYGISIFFSGFTMLVVFLFFTGAYNTSYLPSIITFLFLMSIAGTIYIVYRNKLKIKLIRFINHLMRKE